MSDDKIDLRSVDEPLFRVDHLDENVELVEYETKTEEQDAKAIFEVANTKIKIKFEKFVNLVATHAYEELFAKYKDEDVVVSADLLTDLANAHGDKEEKSVYGMLALGVFIGAVIVWLFVK